MKIKDLISVIEGNAAMNIITESMQRLYMDKADLLERTVKEIEIIRNEFLM